MNGINYPVDSSSYELFEINNNIPINVFKINDKNNEDMYNLIYISKLKSEKPRINLLLIEDNEKRHYVWIKNLRAFIRQGSVDLYVCDKCLCKFKLESAYNNHIIENKCIEYDNTVKKHYQKMAKIFTHFIIIIKNLEFHLFYMPIVKVI